MALKIVESCVNCFACYDVCPSNAIYQSSPHFKINPKNARNVKTIMRCPSAPAFAPMKAILSADGLAMNPPGLNGNSTRKMAEAMREIQTR